MERDKKIHHPLLCRYFVTVGSVLGWGREKEREGKKKKKEKEKKKEKKGEGEEEEEEGGGAGERRKEGCSYNESISH